MDWLCAWKWDSTHGSEGQAATQLAQSVEHEILNSRVMGLGPTLGTNFLKKGDTCWFLATWLA